MSTFGDQLRMQAESRSDVTGGRRQLMVPRPSLWRTGHGEGEHAIALATLHRGRVVGVEIEVAMKIDETRSHGASYDGAARTPVSKRPTSFNPRR